MDLLIGAGILFGILAGFGLWMSISMVVNGYAGDGARMVAMTIGVGILAPLMVFNYTRIECWLCLGVYFFIGGIYTLIFWASLNEFAFKNKGRRPDKSDYYIELGFRTSFWLLIIVIGIMENPLVSLGRAVAFCLPLDRISKVLMLEMFVRIVLAMIVLGQYAGV